MSSEHDIENVMYRYGEYVDLARFDELGELFRHGAIRSDRGSGDLRGEAVATFYRATNRVHLDTGTLRTRHIASNVIIEVDEPAGTATARSYFVVCQQTSVLPLQPIVAGRYHDTFRRIEGEWWFDLRMIYVELIGDMTQHLSFDLRHERAPRF
ncbi:MAG: nuclear transport factor 2 family protein [Actinobacteria bacterium]|nr:MAG: nuclear transport factor 2 family protein [Actinomycetota bacterium]